MDRFKFGVSKASIPLAYIETILEMDAHLNAFQVGNFHRSVNPRSRTPPPGKPPPERSSIVAKGKKKARKTIMLPQEIVQDA